MPNPDDLRIFTTSWTAPAWMKYTNEITWGEGIPGEAGFLVYPAQSEKILHKKGCYIKF